MEINKEYLATLSISDIKDMKDFLHEQYVLDARILKYSQERDAVFINNRNVLNDELLSRKNLLFPIA